MAYTPRTAEDKNRLAAALAVNPALAAQVYPTGGSEAQSELPTTQRVATEADAASLGVTVDDIRRMMSNPSRYGKIYAPAAADGISPQAKTQPAVDNAKRTKTVKKADGTDKAPTPPLPPKRPTDATTPQSPSLAWWMAPLGAVAAVKKTKGTNKATGAEELVDVGVPPKTAGAAAMAVPDGELDAMIARVAGAMGAADVVPPHQRAVADVPVEPDYKPFNPNAVEARQAQAGVNREMGLTDKELRKLIAKKLKTPRVKF